ncbi:hypothetical protein D5086_010888 [Populus alba]|uniref:Uncharacterized protein n=1 Tax=Populus alba TaxID=43335 RepID=A0ACC4CC73_POPAL
MYSLREREQRRIVDQRCEILSHGLGVLEREVDKCRRLFYDLEASWEKESLLLYSVVEKGVSNKGFRRLKQEATEVTINAIQDSRANLLDVGGNDTVQPCDTTQVRSDSDFGVKSATVQVYGNSHNSPSDRWIGLIFYVDSPDISYYLGLKLQVNRSSVRHPNTGQQRLYGFCYLLPFDLWTSYLIRIPFLQGCGSWFWEFPSSTRIFNELQYNLLVWQGFINVSESFS